LNLAGIHSARFQNKAADANARNLKIWKTVKPAAQNKLKKEERNEIDN